MLYFSLKVNSYIELKSERIESISECLRYICYTYLCVFPYNLSVSRHVYFSKLEYKLTSVCETYEMMGTGQKTCYQLKFHS